MCKRVTTHTHTHTHTYTYSDACIEPPLRAAVPTPKAPRKRVPARVRTLAHRRCGRAQRAAPHRSPAERVRHSARRRAGSGAYRGQRGDRRDVPAANVRVERRRRVERLRPEAARAPRPTGKGSHGLGLRVLGRARSTSPPTRAHTADPSPSHTGARIHHPDRFSHIQIHG
jgi:hypothetical protein